MVLEVMDLGVEESASSRGWDRGLRRRVDRADSSRIGPMTSHDWNCIHRLFSSDTTGVWCCHTCPSVCSFLEGD